MEHAHALMPHIVFVPAQIRDMQRLQDLLQCRNADTARKGRWNDRQELTRPQPHCPALWASEDAVTILDIANTLFWLLLSPLDELRLA